MTEAEASLSEARLRECLRDLVGLQSLPAVWAGHSLEAIAASAADSVAAIAGLDFVFLRLSAPAGPPVELALLDGRAATDAERAEVQGWLGDALFEPSGALRTLEGGSPRRVLVVPLGFYGHGGVAAFGARAPGFPDTMQTVILRAAAGLLATSAQSARLVAEAEIARTRAALLSEATAVLSVSLGHEEVLSRVVALAVPRLAELCFARFAPSPDEAPLTAVARAESALSLAIARENRDAHDFERHLRDGAALLPEVAPEVLLPGGRGLREPLSAMMVRLTTRGGASGVLAFVSPAGERRYGPVDLELAVELGRRAGMALENATLYRDAREADRRKDEFLAMLGHELRNPLAPILTTLELMRLRDDSSGRERHIIERHARHMVRLVDDLLDVSRVTRGQIRIERRPVVIARVLARAVEMVTPLVEQRGHALKVQPAGEDVVVTGDEARLTQVVSNLLNNAAKYTDPGGHLELASRVEGGEIIISVRDDGIGIRPEMLRRVFDLFAQEDRGLDRSLGGLGVGLSVVKALVELHGGKVSAHSRGLGYGSEFTLRLPCERRLSPPPREEEPACEEPVRPRRVLVVDDNGDSAQLLAEVLSDLGFDSRTAHDGASALNAVEAFRPEVVLLDIGLPVMDGFQVADRLRRAHGPGMHLVAVSGYGQESDRRRALEAGFDAHLAKPVDVRQLLRTIEDVEARKRN